MFDNINISLLTTLLAPSIDFLLQFVPLINNILHHFHNILANSRALLSRDTFPRGSHKLHNSLQLVGKPGDNRTATRRRRMRATADDVSVFRLC